MGVGRGTGEKVAAPSVGSGNLVEEKLAVDGILAEELGLDDRRDFLGHPPAPFGAPGHTVAVDALVGSNGDKHQFLIRCSFDYV